MKQVFLKNNNSKSISILFAGWGMDENVFKHSLPKDSDFMICYDYNSLNFDAIPLHHYNKIRVIGWSLGVWAASVIMENLSKENRLKIVDSIAINGTLTPIDDECGIPKAIYQGTIDNFSERGLYKFNRRMCGSSEELELFNSIKPHRELDDLKLELISIQSMVSSYVIKENLWHNAIIGENDMIFPKYNQLNAWRKNINTNTEIKDIAHYSEKFLKETIENF